MDAFAAPADLLGLARNKSIAARASLAVSLSEMYFDGPKERSERERELMAEVLRALIKDVDQSMRQKVGKTPQNLEIPVSDMARILGSESVSEVENILLESESLTDDDLIAIVRRRDETYRRRVAERPGIGATVTDSLIALADEAIVLRALANRDAAFSPAAMDLLIARAEASPALASLLTERPELTADHEGKLASYRKHFRSKNDTADAVESTTAPPLPKWMLRRLAQKSKPC